VKKELGRPEYDLEGNIKTKWLRHYATSRKVAGSSPDEVIGFFSIDLTFRPY
jgi:hypothetical protein